jgi:hypothetical protein
LLLSLSSTWPVNYQLEKAIDCFVKSLPVWQRIALALTIIGDEHDLELEVWRYGGMSERTIDRLLGALLLCLVLSVVGLVGYLEVSGA